MKIKIFSLVQIVVLFYSLENTIKIYMLVTFMRHSWRTVQYSSSGSIITHNNSTRSYVCCACDWLLLIIVYSSLCERVRVIMPSMKYYFFKVNVKANAKFNIRKRFKVHSWCERVSVKANVEEEKKN